MPDPQQTLSYATPGTSVGGLGIGTIALQLVGVYCFVLALPALVGFAAWVGASGVSYSGAVIGALVPLVLYGAMGVLLIRFASRLSLWLFRDHAAGVMAGPVAPGAGQYVQAVAFAVLGVFVMVNAAPQIISLIYAALMVMGRQFDGYGLLVEPSMRFLLGLGLFLQSKGLSLLWHKLRTGGVVGPQPERESAESERV